jgi:hypothetical protein
MRDEVGAMLGEGLIQGVNSKGIAAQRAGHRLVDKLTHGAEGGLQGVRTMLGRITDLIGKKLDGKKEAGKRKALLREIKAEKAALIANGKAQDRNTAKLTKARQKLHDLTREARDYAANIKASVVSYGSVVGLGTQDGSSSVSITRLISQLTARAADAKQYAKLINQLRKAGLNKTTIQQLLDAGVEGGLATAQALASGGAAAISQVNSLTSQIAATGQSLGQKMKDADFSAGLKAAQGLVDGLQKKQRQLDRIAERLADTLVRKVKKALGIHSPSRVFRDIGKRTVEGLTIGLNDTHVKRAGTDLASALTTGFGRPALAAYMTANGTGAAAGQTIHITLTAQQLDQLSRGRAIQADLDAYRLAGGRPRT